MKTGQNNGEQLSISVTATTLGFMLALLLVANVEAAPLQTQTFQLQPGWNAIYLEVAPANPTISAVFAGLPIDSVWTFQARLTSVDFIQDPAEPVWNRSSWLVHLPTNRFESFQNNLFTLQANRPYLVKLGGSVAVTLNVTGRPSLRQDEWVPDAYNLRGFPIDPAVPPTFQSFFAPSLAHFDAATSSLRKIYRMNAAGQWTVVAPNDLMRRGEAYWVFTRGASDYIAPLTVEVELGDGLDYGDGAAELSLRLRNRSNAARTVNIDGSVGPVLNVLSYARLNVTNGVQWVKLPSSLPRVYASGGSENLRLAVSRADFANALYETVLIVTDGAGTRFMIPVSARKFMAGGGGGGGGFGGGVMAMPGSDEAKAHAGLWIGRVTVNAVSEVHSGNLVTNLSEGFTVSVVSEGGQLVTNRVPNSVSRANVSFATTPTRNEFTLRLLLHVDANGQTRLLKEVIQMWQDGVYTNDAEGILTLASPGRHVLLTEDSLIPLFQGATVKDGESVGRRFSTADFDFPPAAQGNFLALNGFFAAGQTVSGTISLSADFPTNPFKHKYHPDNARGYAITRALELSFASAPANAPPSYGYSEIGGTYRETLSGLHRTNIVTSGTFNLRRVVTTGALNQ